MPRILFLFRIQHLWRSKRSRDTTDGTYTCATAAARSASGVWTAAMAVESVMVRPTMTRESTSNGRMPKPRRGETPKRSTKTARRSCQWYGLRRSEVGARAVAEEAGFRRAAAAKGKIVLKQNRL